MTPDGFQSLREAGVLGMNFRNAGYIMAHNARSKFPLVDDKVQTKRLAEKFGIPSPELYAVVENHGDIAKLPAVLNRLREFVIKPARGSDGKANLHQGAIGAGIDIGSGVTMTAVDRSRIVDRHPDTENPVSGIHLPHWDKLLMMAAEATDMTGLGYLGADFVLDREKGPVLLELNARPGLGIQMANRSGLRPRLDQTDRAQPDVFSSPASRVAWAQDHFRQAST